MSQLWHILLSMILAGTYETTAGHVFDLHVYSMIQLSAVEMSQTHEQIMADFFQWRSCIYN